MVGFEARSGPMPQPQSPKLYHIVHLDKLPHILRDSLLFCDAVISKRHNAGTVIGMGSIKERRLTKTLDSHPDLCVGECVPFYFCPRSIMLYLIHCRNPKLDFRGGQGEVVHLELDLRKVVRWANQEDFRWAFTLSNAASNYFEDRCDLNDLSEINWDAVQTDRWGGAGVDPQIKDGKQAEFLVENRVPWGLIERIGVSAQRIVAPVSDAMNKAAHRPRIEIRSDWYY